MSCYLNLTFCPSRVVNQKARPLLVTVPRHFMEVLHGSVTGSCLRKGGTDPHKGSVSAVQLGCQAPLERAILFKRAVWEV